VPKDVQDKILKPESETEEIKSWMALGSRDKSALMTRISLDVLGASVRKQ
jgi:hypothetical protein